MGSSGPISVVSGFRKWGGALRGGEADFFDVIPKVESNAENLRGLCGGQ